MSRRGARRAGARLIFPIIFLIPLPGCLWEGSGATLTPPVTGGTAQAVTLVTQENAAAFAQVTASAINKTLIAGKIANDVTAAVAPVYCNDPNAVNFGSGGQNSVPGAVFVGCDGQASYAVPAFMGAALQVPSDPTTSPITGVCDSPSPNSSDPAAGTYTITASYADPAFQPPPGALYQTAVGNTLDVQFTDCVIHGIDMDGGFVVTHLSFADDPFTPASTELVSGWLMFEGLVIRNVGHVTSFNTWDGGSGQKYMSFTTSDMPDGSIQTDMTTGDMVLTQDQSNQNLENILVSLDFSYAYQPATDNIALQIDGHVNIDSEFLGIHKADLLVATPAIIDWYNSENAPYAGTAEFTENSIATATPARMILTVQSGGSVQLDLDLDGNGVIDGAGSIYPWADLAGAY